MPIGLQPIRQELLKSLLHTLRPEQFSPLQIVELINRLPSLMHLVQEPFIYTITVRFLHNLQQVQAAHLVLAGMGQSVLLLYLVAGAAGVLGVIVARHAEEARKHKLVLAQVHLRQMEEQIAQVPVSNPNPATLKPALQEWEVAAPHLIPVLQELIMVMEWKTFPAGHGLVVLQQHSAKS
jgi:hypothetical protein